MSVLKLKNEETGEFEVIEVISGKEGPQGPKGEDGYTPQRGIDYFTDEDIVNFIDEIVELLPQAEEVEF
jgi:hypothetical protein